MCAWKVHLDDLTSLADNLQGFAQYLDFVFVFNLETHFKLQLMVW
jgi:hypothetical protein